MSWLQFLSQYSNMIKLRHILITIYLLQSLKASGPNWSTAGHTVCRPVGSNLQHKTLLYIITDWWNIPLLSKEENESFLSESVLENSFKKLWNLLECVSLGIFPQCFLWMGSDEHGSRPGWWIRLKTTHYWSGLLWSILSKLEVWKLCSIQSTQKYWSTSRRILQE